jgi:hypothetical protein
MRQALVICAVLFVAAFALAQTNNSAAGQPGAPVLVTPIVAGAVPVPYGGLLIQGGYATTVGLSYPPLLVTPTATLANVSSSPIGATNGTSNLQVGATNSTLESSTTPLPAVQTALEVSQPGGVVPMAYAQVPPQVVEAGVGETGLGAAQFDVVNARGPGDTRSLAEVARAVRQEPKPSTVRTYTNADVQNLKAHEKPPQNPQ